MKSSIQHIATHWCHLKGIKRLDQSAGFSHSLLLVKPNAQHPAHPTPVKSTVASPVLVGQHALASIQWIHVVDEQLAVSCGHQQPWKLLDPKTTD